MSRRADLESILEGNLQLRKKLAEAEDVAARIRVIANAPCFSFWAEIRAALEEASEEIDRLKARVRSLEGEDA